jgi:predicted  nucleic acid-binding Zn-ribbon protein
MQNPNAAESLHHLQEEIQKEMREMAEIQQKLQAEQTDLSQRRAEIPQLQREFRSARIPKQYLSRDAGAR